MATRTGTVEVVNRKGLHARASSKFARLVGTFKSDVQVIHQGDTASGESIMDLMMLVAHQGCEIAIEVSGPDADEALSALVTLVKNGFGELAADKQAESEEAQG